jgi:hypothetical protein
MNIGTYTVKKIIKLAKISQKIHNVIACLRIIFLIGNEEGK